MVVDKVSLVRCSRSKMSNLRRRLLAILLPSLGVFGVASPADAVPDTSKSVCRYNPESPACCPAGATHVTVTGSQCFFGGPGTQCIAGSESGNLISAGPGADFIRAGGGDDVVLGGLGNDVIVGENGNDVLAGGLGDDLLFGSAGNDDLDGGFGDDVLYGEEGNDDMDGGPGDDLLLPGPGVDHVNGGLGNDVVVLTDVSEIVAGKVLRGGAGRDLLITPVPVAQLRAAGMVVEGFEDIVVHETPPGLRTPSGPLFVLPQMETRSALVGSGTPIPLKATVAILKPTPSATFDYVFEIFDDRGVLVSAVRGSGSGSVATRLGITNTWVPSEALPAGNYHVGVRLIWNPDTEFQIEIPPQIVINLGFGDQPDANYLCKLMGHNSRAPQNSRVYGTDLGFSAKIGDKIHFMFGDTWQSRPGSNDGPLYPTDTGNNDLLASVSASAFPTSSQICPTVDVPTEPTGFGERFRPIVVPGYTMPALRTPSAAIAYGGELYGIVVGNEAPPPAVAPDVPVPLFVRYLEGTPQAELLGKIDAPLPVTVLDKNNDPAPFTAQKFLFPSMATGNDAGGPFEHNIFVWGWGFYANGLKDPESGTTYPNNLGDLYLLAIDANSLPSLSVRYWANESPPSVPSAADWSANPVDAKPVNPFTNEAKATGLATVRYEQSSGLWWMLYGGASAYKGQAICREGDTDPVCMSPVNAAGGIYIRSAPKPWGPWSPRKVLYSSALLPPLESCKIFYKPGLVDSGVMLPNFVGQPDSTGQLYLKQRGFLTSPFGCVTTDLAPCKNDTDCGNKNPFLAPGGEYAPAFVDGSAMATGGGGFTVNWLMSSYNPYEVHVMRSTIPIPGQASQ